MDLFFSRDIEKDIIMLAEEESKHAVKVMRAMTGDEIFVTDGNGRHFRTSVADGKSKKCVLKIIEELQPYPKPPYHLHIAIAPTKNHDRLEWFVEKATEIGISEITPLACHHSEREKVHPERLERIIIAAMKQSCRFWLPKLNKLVSFDDFIRHDHSCQKFIAYCTKQERKYLHNIYTPGSNALILIGPEGDFSPEEIKLALVQNFQAISLGENRYRTETAALMACHTIVLMNEKKIL